MESKEKCVYGTSKCGKEVKVYTMQANNGSSVELCNLGATILSVKVPDKEGNIEDVALGFTDYENLILDGACVGRSVGRVANRIADGKMTIEGKEYSLEINNGVNHLHGGSGGFNNCVWDSKVEGDKVIMTLESADGDQNYPGNLSVEAVFSFDENYTLQMTFTAKTDKTTVVNMTNHSYFNLSGGKEPNILNHELKLNSTKVLEMNENQIPTGKELEIAGTAMDFRNFKNLGEDIKSEFNHIKDFRGYDHFFVTDGYEPAKMSENAILRDPKSGRTLTVLSTAPGLMIYTGNYLACGSPITKSGKEFNEFEGVAMECQIHPNAVNMPDFPSVLLKPEETYSQTIVFKFGVN